MSVNSILDHRKSRPNREGAEGNLIWEFWQTSGNADTLTMSMIGKELENHYRLLMGLPTKEPTWQALESRSITRREESHNISLVAQTNRGSLPGMR